MIPVCMFIDWHIDTLGLSLKSISNGLDNNYTLYNRMLQGMQGMQACMRFVASGKCQYLIFLTWRAEGKN